MGTLPPHSYPGVGTAGEREAAVGRYYVGTPDGPEVFAARMGISVPTFTERREDLRIPKDSGNTWLMHHVPPNKRGFYRPHQMANYDETIDYRVDQWGYLLCDDYTLQDTPCKRRAVNYSSRCQAHGGKLHPLDKVVDERRPIEAETKPETIERLTRWQKLLSGFITVDDLDDEEISRGQCRDSRGGFTGNPPSKIPKEIKDAMTKRVFERVNETFMHDLIGSAETMMRIATGDAYEPADQLNAAKWVIERMMGKQPEVVIHTATEPWEEIFEGVGGGSRAESRVARGVATDDDILELETRSEDVVYAEVEDVSEEASEIVSFEPEDAGVSLFTPAAVEDPLERQRMFPPPQGPEARQRYEDELARVAAEDALTPEENALRLKDRIRKERARRYVARANGLASVRNLPIVVERYEIASRPGIFRVKFLEPSDAKVPAAVKAKETKLRNMQRRARVY